MQCCTTYKRGGRRLKFQIIPSDEQDGLFFEFLMKTDDGEFEVLFRNFVPRKKIEEALSQLPGYLSRLKADSKIPSSDELNILNIEIDENVLYYEEKRDRSGAIHSIRFGLKKELAHSLLEGGFEYIGDIVLSSREEVLKKTGLFSGQVRYLSRLLKHFGFELGTDLEWKRPK